MAEETFKLVLETKLNDILGDEFKQYMHEEFYRLMFNRIPFLTGNLASTENVPKKQRVNMSPEEAMQKGLSGGHITKDGILFTADYATRQYYTNKNRMLWAQKTFESDKDALVKRLQEYISKERKPWARVKLFFCG